LKSLGFVLSFDACSDIYTTTYSGGPETFVKLIKNAGGEKLK